MTCSGVLRQLGCTILLTSIFMWGCGGSGSGTTSADSSNLSRAMAPVVASSSEQAAVTAITSLGTSLLAPIQGNAVVAPFSASLSLARLHAGAAGQTRVDLTALMLLTSLDVEMDPVFNKLDLAVAGRIGACKLGLQTSQASADAWIQSGYGYLRTFLDTLALNYGIHPSRIDFAAAPYASFDSISSWAKLSGLDVSFSGSRDSRLALGDLERLNAAWASPFDPAQTSIAPFTLVDGSTVDATFARQRLNLNQTTGNGYLALDVPLANSDLRMTFILPDQGRFAEIQTLISAGWLKQLFSTMSPASIDLALPLFSVETSLALPLAASATTRDVADFSATDGTRDLFVSNTLHHSKLFITEAGINAGTATLIALDDAHPDTWTNPDSPPWSGGVIIYQLDPVSYPYLDITLGRPFIFAVRDSVSGAVLFLGRVLNPNQ